MQVRAYAAKLSLTWVFALLLQALAMQAFAREQWQMQQPEGAPPSGPVGKGYVPPPSGSVPGLVGSTQNSSSIAPGLMAAPEAPYAGPAAFNRPGSISNEMIEQMISSRIGAGSVLTGVLGDDISSKKSVSGDLFSIVLVDGYSQNGKELVPRGARIIGKIVLASPAAMQRQVGASGNVQVGLTTLIFPDGRSTPFTGFIDRNPAHDMKKAPVVRGPGLSLSDYKSSVGSMMNSLTFGLSHSRRLANRGKDILLEEGDVVPVRLTRSIDLTKMTPPTAAPGVPLANPFSSGPMPGLLGAPGISASGASANYASQTQGGSFSQPLLPKELPEPF